MGLQRKEKPLQEQEPAQEEMNSQQADEIRWLIRKEKRDKKGPLKGIR